MTFASHLKPDFHTDVEKVPTRNGYGEGLLEAGKRDERVVALCCDLTESTRTDKFAEAFPKRFIEVGVAEQNLASVGSGMAAMGKIPFIASYAAFSPGRNWEQIRTTIAYNNSNVKVLGAHAGVSVGPDGATHQMTEDIALMRAMPNMVVLAPADVHEVRKATLAAAQYDGPVYLRVGRSATPVVTTKESPFEIGKGEIMYQGDSNAKKKVGLIVTGSLLYNALIAAKESDGAEQSVSVLHLPTIKPLDTAILEEFASDKDALITIEEHQIIGGLGSAVAEHVSATQPIKTICLGMNDCFGQSGEPEELLSHYGMDIPTIIKTIHSV